MSSSGISMTVATRRLGRTFGPGWILSATPPAPRLKSPPTCWTYGCSDSCARRPWITNILSSPRMERPRRRVPNAARASPTRTAACDAESAASRPASKTLGPVRIPVETVRPKLTHRSRISGREPQRNMTLSEAAAPPGRGKDVLVEFPQDELIAKWEEFFEEMGYLSKIIAIADRFPEDRSLLVAFDELNRFDTDMAIYLLRHPLNVLLAGEEAIRRLAPPGDEGAQIHLRVKLLPRDRRVPVRALRAKHLGQYIAVEGLVRKSTEVRPRVTDALFQCLRCGTIIKEPQDGQTFREPLECYEEQGGCKRSASATKFKLLTETSLFVDTQKLEIQEAPEGLRGGEEPQRLTLYLEDDLTGRIRGDIRVLMVGDPGSGKRELLSYMSRLSPRGIYATGKAATAAGLCVAADSLITTDRGIQSVEDLVEPYFRGVEHVRPVERTAATGCVGTFDDRHRLGMRPLEAVWRLTPPANMLRIATSSGLSLTVTPPTKVLVDHAMGQSWIQAKFVRPGMRIATASRLEVPEGEAPLTLSLLQRITTRIVVEVDPAIVQAILSSLKTKYGTLREAAARLMITEDAVYHVWKNGRHGIPLAQLLRAALAAGTAEEDVATSVRSYSQFGGHRITLPVRLDQDLAYFAGLIAGDGSVEQRPLGGFAIRFNNSDPVLIQTYTDLVHRLFEVHVDFTGQTPQRAATVRFHSRLVASILSELGVPTSPKSHRLDLPGILLNGPSKNLTAYLRGLFDTDGTIQIRTRGSSCLSLTTSSQGLGDRVQLALLRFGIHATRRIRRVAGRRTTRADGTPIVTRHDQCVLDIRDWHSMSRFRELIGFNHPRKKEILESMETRRPHSNIDLISGAGPHLHDVRGLLGLSPAQAYGSHAGGGLAVESGAEAVTREALLQLIDGLETAHRNGTYRGTRIRLGSDLREKIRESLRSAGHTGVSLANELDLPKHRIHDSLYRRSRCPTRLPIHVLQRIEKLLGGDDPGTAAEIAAELAPILRRIERIPSRFEFLRLLSCGDVRWEPVKEIEVKSSSEERTVFDLSVRDSHAFVANGILVHNTAAAVRDEFGEGRWTLEAGALVLADLGLAAIDEIEKMNPQDRSAIHEAMEQQRISVAKAGITAVLQARCAVLAAANPKFGRFDEHKYISEQIDLPPALLSRFDIIFSMIDRPQADRDRALAEQILKGHRVGEIRRRREAGLSSEETQALEEPYTPHFNPDFLRKYVAYAKRLFPVMTEEAMGIIERKYLEIRKTGEAAGSSVPITPRQLEAIIRLSEAGARLRLSESVTADDAERAVRITEYWMGKVAGEEGRFDIDIIQTGISQSQREQIISIRDIINELAGPDGVADYEDIVRIAQERGIPPAKVDSWLKRWAQEGEIYSPVKNKYKLVERL